MSSEVKSSMPSDLKNVNNWTDDMRYWPNIMYGDIYNYLISSKAVDGAEMKNYKSLQSYNYFQSGNVDKILHCVGVNNRIYLKADVRASQTVNKVNETFVICTMDGVIEEGWCTCMAGQGLSCSHVGAILWKVEHAVRNNMTGVSCTDETAKWNRGTKRNVEPKSLANIAFKKPKLGDDLIDDNVNVPGSRDTPMYLSAEDLRSAVQDSPLLPLFQIKNTTINKSFNCQPAVKDIVHQNHSEHDSLNSCEKCSLFYLKYVTVDSDRLKKFEEETVTQSKSLLWRDARKIRITASSASKVPIKETTDCTNFIREHLHSKFVGNKFTKHGQENEHIAKEYMISNGHDLVEKGIFVSVDENWLSASPDGIINGDTVLEIKCPVPTTKWSTLIELFHSKKYDVFINQAGNIELNVKGTRGFYMQVQLTMFCTGLKKCKLLIWLSPNDFKFIDVKYDDTFVRDNVNRLRSFYAKKMMNRIVDEIEEDRLVFSKSFKKFMRL